MNDKVWFITGASTGFGRCLVDMLLQRGSRVVATARDVSKLSNNSALENLLEVHLDVTVPETIVKGVEAAIKRFGRIDVLVNNAGFGLIGAVEEISDAEARRLFDTNVFGLLNVTRAVLPVMRAQASGIVVNMGSVAGLVAVAGGGIYGATKFAVEGISDALAQEVAPLGIDVMIVEPGPFRTDAHGRSLVLAETQLDAYASTSGARRKMLETHSGMQPGDPDKAAALIIDIVQSGDLPGRLPLGGVALDLARAKFARVLADFDLVEARSRATSFTLE